MDSISRFLYLGFSTLIFCIGFYVFVISFNEYSNLLAVAIDNYQDEDIVLEVGVRDNDIESYSKGYLITLLLEPLDYNIQIDEYLIEKNFHSKNKINEEVFLYDYYVKEYVYDLDGNITRIKFTGI